MGKSNKKQSDPFVLQGTKSRTYDRAERKTLNQQIRKMKYSNAAIDPDEEDEDWEDEDWEEDEEDEDDEWDDDEEDEE